MRNPYLFLLAAMFVLFFILPTQALADSKCRCLGAGKLAWSDDEPTSSRRIEDGCTTIDERDAWNAGISDERYDWDRGREKWCSSGNNSSSNNNSSPSGVYRADWMVWLYDGQTIDGCSYGSTLHRGYCFEQCPQGYHGYHLTRGDVCVRCPSGASRVAMQGDGQVYCYQ